MTVTNSIELEPIAEAGVMAYIDGGDTWANLKATTGNEIGDNSDTRYPGISPYSTINTYVQIERGILIFPTYVLPDDSTIKSSVFSVYGYSKNNALGDPSANIYNVTTLSDTSISASDYDTCGTTAYCNTPIPYASWNDVGWNNFTLNATGLAAISKTGVTKICIREVNFDVANVEPTWAVGFSELDYFSARYDVIHKPKLKITFSYIPKSGHIWIESNDFHYIDSSGVERICFGLITAMTKTATNKSYIWIEGNNFDYIDNSLLKRVTLGVPV